MQRRSQYRPAGFYQPDKMEEEETALPEHLQDCQGSSPDDPSHHFNIGALLWEKGGQSKEVQEKAAEQFLISAKLNPQNGAAFRYLGHYYSSVSPDSQRAFKCFQRAITLDPDDSSAGEALCDMLDREGKETLEIALCREASERSPRAFWAFRRFGYLQIHQKKWSEAVQSLQHAIRGYPTCSDLWEALGLAYQRLGMFTAAIKSYGRAVELEDSKIFALIECGNILLMLGSFRKGIEQFRRALEISPQNTSANFSLASALLGLSKECISMGAFRWGASLLEEACKITEVCTTLASNMSCIWKLHGDIQLAYAKCYPWTEEESCVKNDVKSFDASILSWKQNCYSAAISSHRSYQRALHLVPWQANIYADVAITSDLVASLMGGCEYDLTSWQLPEKMSLGGLLLEGDKSEFWVALGCLSDHNALKQHAFIRGLQLNTSLAIAWAYLGKLYREVGKKQLARQAFDCARSIDPSLALSWAGMAADSHARGFKPEEGYESCLRAVQIFPLAEFQIGLAKLSLVTGHLSSSQVFAAIQQAIERAPHYPESHNLKGLVCEARYNYEAAAASYRLARCAINTSSGVLPDSCYKDISINLARSLLWAGNELDAARECEELKKEGLLDAEGLQIYALSLWKLDKSNAALSVARELAATVNVMEHTSRTATFIFICRLLYHISGMEAAVNSILKLPKELSQGSKVSFLLSAIHALDPTRRLESAVSNSRSFLISYEEIIEMHSLVAISKLIRHGSEHCLDIRSGLSHLRKAIHLYPSSSSLRNLLGYLLISSKEWNDPHLASRCCFPDLSDCICEDDMMSASEILGAGAVSCYGIGNNDLMFSFPTSSSCLTAPGPAQQLQKWLHQEPWNLNARYLLTLNLLQKAREERYPQHLRVVLERLLIVALSNQLYSKKDASYQYKKFQLLLCASEISLQGGKLTSSIRCASDALALRVLNADLFFAHLQLCRTYAVQDNLAGLQEEYIKCLELRTDCHIGWVCLKFIGSLYRLESGSNIVDSRFKECLADVDGSSNMWLSVFDMVCGLIALWNGEFILAEEHLARSCSKSSSESCFFLCHGAVSMELARKQYGSQFLSSAVKSLVKAQTTSPFPLPFVSALLAQAEGSLGFKPKWEKHLRLEWFSWPPELRPAEVIFQMHLLAEQSKPGSASSSNVETCQSPLRWVLRAIHLNPSCWRYWKVLGKLLE